MLHRLFIYLYIYIFIYLHLVISLQKETTHETLFFENIIHYFNGTINVLLLHA